MNTRSSARVGGIFLVTFLMFLSACSLPKIGVFVDEATPGPEEAVTANEMVSAPPSGGAEEPAEPGASVAPVQAGELTAADFAEGQGGIHGLIVFQSAADQPFVALTVGAANLPYPERHLWAFSPDGARAGRISPSGFGSDIHLPRKEGDRPAILQYGLEVANDAVDVVIAPEMCGGDGARFDPDNPPCGGFQFSPDRRYLAFYSGPYACGRSLHVVDLQTGELKRTFEGARWAYFQEGGALMVASGDCETSRAGVYIPQQDSYTGAGIDGIPFWNPRRSAVIFQVATHYGARQVLWGFNLETSKVFLWMDQGDVAQDTPAWTPDGESFLFQHRRIRYDNTNHTLVTEGPRQIVWMNANTRSQKLLSAGGAYEYHLCTRDGAPCDEWYGDYVQVMRTPYRKAHLPFDPETGQFKDPEAARCALFGQDCPEPPEPYALNWKTGELIPWEEAGLADPAPALPGAPDYNAAPIYEADGVAYYPGLDGRSLWRVEGDQETLVVQDGQDFLYLP